MAIIVGVEAKPLTKEASISVDAEHPESSFEAAHAVLRRPAASGRARRILCLAMIALGVFAAVAGLRIGAPDAFDRPITMTVNLLARRWMVLDYALRALDEFNLLQGVPLVALAFAAFASTRDSAQRVTLVAGCVSAALAAVCSRGLQLVLPQLPRPLFDPTLPFRPPYGADVLTLKDWSSFPSDHAALLWGLATATLIANRRVGALAVGLAATSSAKTDAFNAFRVPRPHNRTGLLNFRLMPAHR